MKDLVERLRVADESLFEKAEAWVPEDLLKDAADYIEHLHAELATANKDILELERRLGEFFHSI